MDQNLDALKLSAHRAVLLSALKEARTAMQAFTDHEGNMPAKTGEFKDLKSALERAEKAISDVEGGAGARTTAQKAAAHVLSRMKADARLAYLIGPGSESWDLLTEAHAETLECPVAEFRKEFSNQLTYLPYPEVAYIQAVDGLCAAVDANRYQYLRSRDLDTIDQGGIFVGMTPSNVVMNGADLDEAIDKAMSQKGGV